MRTANAGVLRLFVVKGTDCVPTRRFLAGAADIANNNPAKIKINNFNFKIPFAQQKTVKGIDGRVFLKSSVE